MPWGDAKAQQPSRYLKEMLGATRNCEQVKRAETLSLLNDDPFYFVQRHIIITAIVKTVNTPQHAREDSQSAG